MAVPDPSIDIDRIETPERVELSADLAGIGSRGLAAILDSLLLAVLAAAALILLLPVLAMSRTTGIVIALVAMFALQWFYFALFEGLRDGQTPGKRAMGLRVRKTGGYPIGWPEALIRNFLRVVDGFGLYAVGVALLLATRKSQRLGDLAAGTVVVRERSWDTGGLARIGYGTGVVAGPEAGHGAAPNGAAGGRLTAEEIETVQEFLSRRGALTPAARNRIALDLAGLLRGRMRGVVPAGAPIETLEDEAFLEAILSPGTTGIPGVPGTPGTPA